MKRAIAYVHVHGPSGSLALAPGDRVPVWAEDQVTNPDAFALVSEAPVIEPVIPAEEPVAVVAQAVAAAPIEPGPVEQPPLAGAKSSKKAWSAYAESVGLQLPDDAGRDDIIEAVRAAGLLAAE